MTMARKRVFVRADMPESRRDRKDLVVSGLEAGITDFILRKGDEDFLSLGRMEAVFFDRGEPVGPEWAYRRIASPEDQEEALSLAGRKDAVLVDATDWAVIPLENLIARFRGTGTGVFAQASERGDAEVYLRALESGADGVVICVDDPLAISSFRGLLSARERVELREVEITGVRPLGNGDRVCVDTCSLMSPGEGMLVGSHSNCLFLVQSESEDGGYVAARPFRVNAGAVHGYAMVPGGGTRYLSEMGSGDPVMLVGRDGGTRTASVGRCKVEVRPMLLVEAESDGGRRNVILQNAETVKLVTKDGAVSATAVEAGDRVLARVSSGGRHFGMRVEETIAER